MSTFSSARSHARTLRHYRARFCRNRDIAGRHEQRRRKREHVRRLSFRRKRRFSSRISSLPVMSTCQLDRQFRNSASTRGETRQRQFGDSGNWFSENDQGYFRVSQSVSTSRLQTKQGGPLADNSRRPPVECYQFSSPERDCRSTPTCSEPDSGVSGVTVLVPLGAPFHCPRSPRLLPRIQLQRSTALPPASYDPRTHE